MPDRKRSGASGSEKRQRPHVVTVRVNGAERRELDSRAERAGLSIPAYIRHQALDVAPPRQRYRPAVETVLLARLVGQIGQIGGDVNLIAEQASQLGWVTDQDIARLDGLQASLDRWGGELLRAMGRGDDH